MSLPIAWIRGAIQVETASGGGLRGGSLQKEIRERRQDSWNRRDNQVLLICVFSKLPNSHAASTPFYPAGKNPHYPRFTNRPADSTTRRKSNPAVGTFEWLENHYTTDRGSWRDAAEIDLNVFTRQTLSHGVAGIEALRGEAASCAGRRDAGQVEGGWQFTTDHACAKIRQL